MNYYISDLHFGHKNVLKHDSRPFDSIEQMNKVLIAKWNAKVQDKDDVWIIGDFCYRSDQDPSVYLKQLKGRKHLIVGNHDKVTLNSASALKLFESVDSIRRISDGAEEVVLCHFPLADWEAKHRGSYHVYGHIHNNVGDVYEFMKKQGRALNAGCMINDYEPVTLDELIENNKIHYS